MYLSGCCGACSRRSLRCHTATFIHLERFEGLSSLESFCAGCAGSPSARYQRSGMTYLVLVYLLCCCGACLRRSLHCHTCAFIHLERFDGLSSARKSSRRLRRSALGSTSQERPYLYASVMPAARLAILRPVPSPSLLRQLGRPGKGITHTDEPSANTLGKVQQRQMRQRSEATKMTCSVSKMRCVSCYST